LDAASWKPRQHVGGLHAHRLGHPAAVGNESRHHRDGVAAGLRKQRGALAVEPLGIGRQLELQADLRLQHGEPAAGGEMVEPVPQAADRLRRIGPVGWHLVLGHGMKVSSLRHEEHRDRPMLDLGTSFLASVSRDPNALAIVDGGVPLHLCAMVPADFRAGRGFDELGLKAGDHLVTALQNNWQAATLHWACQFAGIIITRSIGGRPPTNWTTASSTPRPRRCVRGRVGRRCPCVS
jgi:hypothetical protein